MWRPFRRAPASLRSRASTRDERPRAELTFPRPAATLTEPRAPSDPTEPIEEAPRRLGRFVLLEQLGAGAMGVVYAAYDERLDRKIAIKLLKARGPRASASLLGEAQALARLAHPNVVSVHDVGELPDGEIFMAMELVRGESLRRWQRAPTRTADELLALYLAAGEGLAAAHRAGVVHRDFKPDNVLVDAEGRPRVVDFGLARDAIGPSEVGSATGIAGTPGYMAPEQFAATRVDARADQFAFAVALHEALYGRRPFPDLAFQTMDDAARALRPVRPPEARDRLVWEAIERALALRPEDRHASMDALLHALRGDRGRARRRAIVASVGAVLSILLAVAWLRHTEARCVPAPDALAGVWDDDVKRTIEASLAKTGLPQANDVWKTAEHVLDRYAARWTEARRAACEDTHVRGVQSAELLDRRMECLDAKRRTLGAVAAVFAAHPREVATKGTDALDLLGELEVCADPALLRLGLPPPRDAGAIAKLDPARRAIADVDALVAAGELGEARRRLDEAATLPAGASYPPLDAELLAARGRLELREGRLADGERTLHQALKLATASRHDQLVAAIWVTLARGAGPAHRPLEESERWVEAADAWLTRLGDGDDRQRLELEHGRGLVLAARGAHREAIEVFSRALESAWIARLADDRRVPLLRARAISLAATGAADRALADHRRALEIVVATWGAKHPEAAATRRALGVLLVEQLGKIDEGAREIEAAREVFRTALGERSAEVAECEHALSQAELFRGRYAAALAHAERADAIYVDTIGPTHRRRGETLVAIGVLRFMTKDYRGSLAAYEAARGILEANLGEEHADVGVLASNIGETLLELQEPSAAAEQFERARAILRRALGPTHRDLALPSKGLGLAHLARGRPNLARPPLEEALQLLEPGTGGDPRELAEVRWALARALDATGAPRDRKRRLASGALEALRALGPEEADRVREIRRALERW